MRNRAPKQTLTSSSDIDTALHTTFGRIENINIGLKKSVKNRRDQCSKLIKDFVQTKWKDAKDDIAKLKKGAVDCEQGEILSALTYLLTELHQCEKFAESNKDAHRKLVPIVKSVLDIDPQINKIITERQYATCITMRTKILQTIDLYLKKYGEEWDALFGTASVDIIEVALTACIAQQRQQPEPVPLNPAVNRPAIAV